jgi:hypothetical protein
MWPFVMVFEVNTVKLVDAVSALSAGKWHCTERQRQWVPYSNAGNGHISTTNYAGNPAQIANYK